jgi:adenosine deaminase
MIAEFIHGVPKAELHVHIEGTLEPALRLALARRNGLPPPAASVEALREAYQYDDLSSFLAVYYAAMDVLRTQADFYDLTYAYLEKARSQNVIYAEMFFDPQAHTSRGIAYADVIGGIRQAQEAAAATLGIESQLIMCFLRDMSAESAMETLEAALPHRDWIIGVGLDSDEKDNPPIKFAEVFARARAEGFRLTMHCDVDQADSTTNIRQCLYEIDVDRIDHGVNVLDEPALAEELARRGLGLTVCPISNKYCAGSLKADELKALLDRGIRATVNSDDPAYFPGYLAENLLEVAEAAPLSKEEVARLVRNAFEIAWLEPARKVAFLAAVDAYDVS